MKYILLLITIIYSSFSFAENIYYLSLKDKLDRPIDGYCLDVAGNESKETYSTEHTWRSLYMQKCQKAEDKFSIWYLKKMK